MYMFRDCESLKELNLSNFNTKKAAIMMNMFENCVNLEKLDISNFRCDKLILVFDLFKDAKKLKELKISLAMAQRLQVQGVKIECENLITKDQTPLNKFVMAKIIPNTNHFNIIEVNLDTDEETILFENQENYDNYTNSY